MAVLLLPVVLEPRALQPRAELPPFVQPKTLPATVGVAAAALQVKPAVQAEQAVRTYPLVPTARATGVFAAVPVTKAPLPVIVEQGIPPPAPPVAVIVVMPREVLSAMPGPAARTFPTLFVSSGTSTPVVMSIPAERDTGK